MTTTSKKLVPNKRFPEFEKSGEWVEKKLEDISSFISSNYSVSSALEYGKYSIYDANKFIGYINNYLCDKDYISIIKDGSGVGRTRYMKAYSNFIGTMNGIVPNDDISPYFLFSLINKINFQQYVKGATIPHIYYSDYSKHIVYITTKEEQKKIADFMSSVDELIELEQKKLEALKEYKKGLLQNIFESNGQDKCIIDRFNCSSDILKNLSVIIMGASPAKEKANTESGIEFHQGKSFFDYLYIKDSKKYTTDYSKQINEDYIIMSVRAPVGEINLTDREIALGRGLCGIKPFKVNKLYLYYYLLYFKNLINYNAKGLVFDSITKSDVEKIYIKFPPDTIQENIGNTLFFIDKIIIEQISKVKKIQEYKKGLLQQLFPN